MSASEKVTEIKCSVRDKTTEEVVRDSDEDIMMEEENVLKIPALKRKKENNIGNS